jgi:hypothetical protein
MYKKCYKLLIEWNEHFNWALWLTPLKTKLHAKIVDQVFNCKVTFIQKELHARIVIKSTIEWFSKSN